MKLILTREECQNPEEGSAKVVCYQQTVQQLPDCNKDIQRPAFFFQSESWRKAFFATVVLPL